MTGSNPYHRVTGRARLPHDVVTAMRGDLPHVADEVVTAILDGVPSYQDALSGPMGRQIRSAVQIALDGFLILAQRGDHAPTPRAPALDGAYQLGRGEARNGRTPEALLAAYRIGARTAWRRLSGTALESGLGPDGLAEFAGLVFLYIDELSDASAAGHAEELSTKGRARERLIEKLAQQLLTEASPEAVDETAAELGWEHPSTLTAVLIPVAQTNSVVSMLSPATLHTSEVADLDDTTLLLVPDAHDNARRALLTVVEQRGAVVGPAKPWRDVRLSFERALRAAREELLGDTDTHLAQLVLNADPEARADLRAIVLAPLADKRPSSRQKLTETLRSWALQQGRILDVAKDLYIHPQTVRYRLSSLRDVYGDSLEDPATLLALTVALA